MIQEFERYHGIVLRSIIVCANRPIVIEQMDERGRINTYIINNEVAVHIKHSAKRLPPWQFSFSVEHLEELQELARNARSVWLVLVCGPDGVVSLSLEEFVSIVEARPGGVTSIRVDRSRRGMYRVYGNSGQLSHAKPKGIAALVQDLSPMAN